MQPYSNQNSLNFFSWLDDTFLNRELDDPDIKSLSLVIFRSNCLALKFGKFLNCLLIIPFDLEFSFNCCWWLLSDKSALYGDVERLYPFVCCLVGVVDSKLGVQFDADRANFNDFSERGVEYWDSVRLMRKSERNFSWCIDSWSMSAYSFGYLYCSVGDAMNDEGDGDVLVSYKFSFELYLWPFWLISRSANADSASLLPNAFGKGKKTEVQI